MRFTERNPADFDFKNNGQNTGSFNTEFNKASRLPCSLLSKTWKALKKPVATTLRIATKELIEGNNMIHSLIIEGNVLYVFCVVIMTGCRA